MGLGLEIVQGTLLPAFLRAEFILVLVLYVAWHSSPLKAAVVGTLFGILQDYFLGVHLGLNGLSKTLLAFSAVYVSRWSAPELGFVRGIMLGIMTLANRYIILGTLLVLGQKISPGYFVEVFSSGAITGIVGEVFFRLYDKIKFPPKDFRRL